jgi:hypothetical protein
MWCGKKCYSSKNKLEFFIADEAQLLMAADGDDDRLASRWIARKDDKERYVDARDRDDLLVSFECNVCIFQKLWDREPNSELEVDKLVMMCIRRVSKPRCILEPSTIKCQRKRGKSERRTAPIREVRFERTLPCPGAIAAIQSLRVRSGDANRALVKRSRA